MESENQKDKTNIEPTQEKPEIVDPELISNLPPELLEVIKFSTASFSGNLPNPVLSKLTAEHISSIINNEKQEDENRFKFASTDRFFKAFYVILVVGALVFLIVALKNNDADLLNKILEILVSFAGGFGVGVGFARSKK